MSKSLCNSCRYFEKVDECGVISSTGTQILTSVKWIEYHCLNGVCIENKHGGFAEVITCNLYKEAIQP